MTDACLVEDDDPKWVMAANWTTASREAKGSHGAVDGVLTTGNAAAAKMEN